MLPNAKGKGGLTMPSVAFHRRTFYHEMARGVYMVRCTPIAHAQAHKTIPVLNCAMEEIPTIGIPRSRDRLAEKKPRPHVRPNPDVWSKAEIIVRLQQKQC